MFLVKCLILLLSLVYHPLQGSEISHKLINEPSSSCLSICKVMEKIEQTTITSKESNQNWINEGLQGQDRLSLLPQEIIGQILSEIINYSDQLAFLRCSKTCQKHALFFTKTHINKLTTCRGKDEERTPHPFIGLLTGLKYLCIIQSNIDNVNFNIKKLEGLTVRSSAVHPNLLPNQHTLLYLDLRTHSLNTPSPDVLQKAYKNNPGLLVLKVSITGGEGEAINPYENLPKLESIEFVDITNNLRHVHHLSVLKNMREIIFSSFDGKQEFSYKEALEIIYQKISLSGLQIILKSVKNSGKWEISYTEAEFINLIKNPLK